MPEEGKKAAEIAEGPFCAPTKNIGLRGVAVADTMISDVDGEVGRLIYRGYDITTLAEQATYEEVVHLLLYQRLPTRSELQAMALAMNEFRTLPGAVVQALRALPPGTSPMDMLQAMIPLLGIYDPDLPDDGKEAHYRKALRLIARMPLVVTAWDRVRNGREVVPADHHLSHAANLLYTLHGRAPDAQTARDMDVCLVLHAEQTFNASSFAARQIASTRAHLYACIAGAVGALSGGLHGGANTQVKEMLEAIGSVDRVRAYVVKTLASGGRVMGMGHAVYKVLDPRAKVLGEMARRLAEKTGERRWYEITEEVRRVTAEEFAKRHGGETIWPNVDFYTPTVYTAMGIPTDMFTAIFAVARVVGWAAHVIEEKFAEAQPKPALYRPTADYVGNYCGPQGCAWVPLDQRQ